MRYVTLRVEMADVPNLLGAVSYQFYTVSFLIGKVTFIKKVDKNNEIISTVDSVK